MGCHILVLLLDLTPVNNIKLEKTLEMCKTVLLYKIFFRKGLNHYILL